MTYGNTTSEQTTYNARLRPATYTLNNMNYQNTNVCCSYPTYSTLTWSYGYYDDGSLEHAWDATNDWFDRAYKYDHAGRLQEASTFRRARGLSPYPAINYPDPYFQNITYDAFNHSNRTGKLYTGEPSDVGTYVNNRRTDVGWAYDADGNTISDPSYQQTIDASGALIHSVSHAVVGDGLQHPLEPRLDITQTYDGGGAPAKRLQISRLPGLLDEFGNPGEPLEDTQTTYYIKSSVLGGATVAEIGWGDTIYVYAAGERIAREFGGNVTFEHHNPATGSWVTSHGHSSYRTTAREERDPRGAETPLSNPFSYAQSYVEWKFSAPLFIEGGDPYDFSSGREIDGMPVSEAEFQRRVGNGSVGLGKMDNKGNVYFAPVTIDFGSSVWIDQWELTYSTSNTEFPLTPLPDGSVVMVRGPSVTTYIKSSGYFITAADGLKLPTNPFLRPLLPQKPSTVKNATPDQQNRFNDAYNEFWKRLHANDGKNPCAELFGGLKKAEKALKGTKFSFGPTQVGAGAEMIGKNVTIDPDPDGIFMSISGSETIQVGFNLRDGQGYYITLNNVQAAAFVLAHEIGHRAGKLRADGHDSFRFLSVMNNGDVQKACFGELTPWVGPLPAGFRQ